MKSIPLAALFLSLLGCDLIASDWPHWRGATRDGHSPEDSGWDRGVWSSLPTAWTAEVGAGGCSVSIYQGRLYTMGYNAGRDSLICLEAATGREVWRQSYDGRDYGRFSRGDKGFYRGPLATPEVDAKTGWIYTLSVDGKLRCWDGNAGGRPVWGMNLYDRFGVPQRPQVTKRGGSHRDYGYTSSPLIQGEQLIVEIGDPKRGNLLGLDKRDGKVLWHSQNRDPAGHSGGMTPITVDGIPSVAVLTALNLVVTRLDAGHEGETIGEFSWVTDFINNIPTPTVSGQDILITSRYNRMAMARLRVTRSGVSKVWEKPFASGVCSPIIDGGDIYWANRGMHCVDFSSGTLKWKGGTYRDAASCILTADKRLIVWSDRGDLSLVESAERSPSRFQQLATRRGVLRDTAWPHVVLSDQRVYCKDRGGRIKCLSLRAGASAEASQSALVNKGAPVSTNSFDLANWLLDRRDVVLGWQAGGGLRNLKGSLLQNGRCRWETRGDAGIAPDRAMAVNAGAFVLRGGDGLHRSFQRSGQFTLEVVLSCTDARQKGPARTVSFSEDAYRRNFTLGQEGDRFVMRLRTTETDDNGTRPEVRFGVVHPGKQTHLLVSYRDGRLECYQNGVVVFSREGHVTGSLANWTQQHLLIGDEWNGSRNWSGTVYGLAIHDHFMESAEAKRRFAIISE